MDDFGEGFFDQFGQPRKRGKERREFALERMLGTASEPAPAPPADEPPPPAAVLRIRNEIAAEFDAPQ
jgi:hypothetical protein